MKLLDTNILIYAAQPPFKSVLAPYILDRNNAVSAICQVETLGYWKITAEQVRWFRSLFQILKVLPVDKKVIERAISVRQTGRLKLGDALIAATCLEADLELITRNGKDFQGVEGLRITDPLG